MFWNPEITSADPPFECQKVEAIDSNNGNNNFSICLQQYGNDSLYFILQAIYMWPEDVKYNFLPIILAIISCVQSATNVIIEMRHVKFARQTHATKRKMLKFGRCC